MTTSEPLSNGGQIDLDLTLWPAGSLASPSVRRVSNRRRMTTDGSGRPSVLGGLARLGYDAEWSILSACAMGAPHSRERLFIVAYAASERLERRGLAAHAGPTLLAGQGLRDRYGRCWATEPRPDGVAYGLPGRVDRLRAQGNAVVPQVAEYVGRLIVAHAQQAVAA